MKKETGYGLGGEKINVKGEDWFVEEIHEGIHTTFVMRHLIKAGRGKNARHVMLEQHLYNDTEIAPQYAERVFLEGALTGTNYDPNWMGEISCSGNKRYSFIDENPEWRGKPLAELAKLLKAGKDNPLVEHLAEAKVEALMQIKDAPIPAEYVDAAREIMEGPAGPRFARCFRDEFNTTMKKMVDRAVKKRQMEEERLKKKYPYKYQHTR